jgi:enterochelin esterase-like enzyme
MPRFFTTEIAQTADNLHLITVKSNALHKRADVTVFVPDTRHPIAGVVMLLHGVYGSHWAWTLKGRVQETARQLMDSEQLKPMLFVMPSDGLFADGSAYLPHQTENYEQWIVDDVPAVVREQFPQVKTDTPFFITGLSMGGYGALRLGAKYSPFFRAFSGLSSITEFSQMGLFVEDFAGLDRAVMTKPTVLDEILANKAQLSPFRFDCGVDDTLIEANRQLHQALTTNTIPHEYEEHTGGHQWEYWQKHIADSLLFFNRFV